MQVAAIIGKEMAKGRSGMFPEGNIHASGWIPVRV